jgi:hypothetical protein
MQAAAATMVKARKSRRRNMSIPGPIIMVPRVDAFPAQTPNDSPRETSEQEPMLYCPVCALRLSQRNCKLFCEQCGYFMSCADYY